MEGGEAVPEAPHAPEAEGEAPGHQVQQEEEKFRPGLGTGPAAEGSPALEATSVTGLFRGIRRFHG